MEEFPTNAAEILSRIDSHRDARPLLASLYVAPRNAIEQDLVSFWSDVLKIYPIGINDDFFELCGDSIHMMQIISRIHGRYSIEISFGEFFDNLTISNLATIVQHRLHEAFE